MTPSPTSHSEPQSFLSKLRERSSIVFTIGLALSIASFVENLHIGKDAIAFVVAELSKIDGWVDTVRAAAEIVHVTLEWWRQVLRELLSLLPVHIPKWLHDPISVLFFGLSRLLTRWSAIGRERKQDTDHIVRDLNEYDDAFHDRSGQDRVVQQKHHEHAATRETTSKYGMRAANTALHVMAFYILPICCIFVWDTAVYAEQGFSNEQIAMLVVLTLFTVIGILLRMWLSPTRQ